MFRTRLCVYVFVGGPLPSTLYVRRWHYVPLLQREECSQVLLAWEVCILSAFSRGCKSRDNSWAQVDIVDSRIELAEVDEIKQEANKVPLLDKSIRICGEAILLCPSAIPSTATSFLLPCNFISWVSDLTVKLWTSFLLYPSFRESWVPRVLRGLLKLCSLKSGFLHPSLTLWF